MRRHKALEEMMMPVVTGLGYIWVGLQVITQGRHSLFRLFIDKMPNGVTIEDCSQVARQLNAVLSVEEVIKGDYTLEISSPGLDRLLFSAEQCKEHIDKTVTIRLIAPRETKRNFKGKLLQVNGEVLSIETEIGLIDLSFSDVAEARLVPKW